MSEQTPEIPDAFNPDAATPRIAEAGLSARATSALENILDLDEIISSASLPERTIRICKSGSLIGDLDDVEGRLEELVDDDGKAIAEDVSLGEGSEVSQLTHQALELRAEIAKQSFPFRVRAMGSAKWKTFYEKWTDSKTQTGLKDGFWDALIIASAVSPPIPDQASLDKFREVFSHRQVDAIGQAAFVANTSSGLDIPKLPPSLVALKHGERS